MKKFAAVVVISILLITGASAMEADDFEYFIEESGANDLIDVLPERSADLLEKAYDGFSFEKIDDPENLFSVASDEIKKNAKGPINVFVLILGIIILCAVLENMQGTIASGSMRSSVTFIVSLVMAGILIFPIKSFIEKVGETIDNSCIFLGAYVPVYAAVTASSGQPMTAASYSAVTLAASEMSAVVISGFIIPFIGILLGVSLIASVSDTFNLSAIASGAEKCIKWIIGILSTVFVGILVIKSIVASAGDSISVRSAKFVVSGFVPVAGSALSESLSTVFACMKYIKGTVGAFGIIAGGFIFLPVIIETLLWMASIHFSGYVAELFSLKPICGILKTVSSVLDIAVSVLLFVILLLIVSTTAVLMAGGA